MKFFNFFLVFITSVTYGQIDAARATSMASSIGIAADAVDLGLLTNDLIYDLLLLQTKIEVCKVKLEKLNQISNNPSVFKYTSGSSNLTLSQKIQYASKNIDMYGRAIRSIMITISKRLQEHNDALKARMLIDSGIGDIEEKIEEEAIKLGMKAARKIPFLGLGATTMVPVKRKLREGNNKMSAVEKMAASKLAIEGYIDQVEDMHSHLDKVIEDVDILVRSYRALVGMNVILMSTTVKEIDNRIK